MVFDIWSPEATSRLSSTQATLRFKTFQIIHQRQKRQVHPQPLEPALKTGWTAPGCVFPLTSMPCSQIQTDLCRTPHEPHGFYTIHEDPQKDLMNLKLLIRSFKRAWYSSSRLM